MKRMKRTLFLAALVVLTACSGTAQPFIGTSVPVVSVPGGASTLALNAATRSATVTVSERGYSGTFTATSSNAAVAAVSGGSGADAGARVQRDSSAGVSATSDGTFTIAGVSNGNATVTFVDQHGQSSTLGVTVSGLTSLVALPNAIQLNEAGQSQTIAVSETGYSGSFTASSSSASVATVSPSSTQGSFTVTAVGSGAATITFVDSNRGSTTVSVGVTISGIVVNDKSR